MFAKPKNDREHKLGRLRCISHSFTFICWSILKQQGCPKYSPNTGHRAQRQCSKCVFSQSLFFSSLTSSFCLSAARPHTHTPRTPNGLAIPSWTLSDVAREENAVVSEHVVWNTSLPSCCFFTYAAAFSRSLPPAFSQWSSCLSCPCHSVGYKNNIYIYKIYIEMQSSPFTQMCFSSSMFVWIALKLEQILH